MRSMWLIYLAGDIVAIVMAYAARSVPNGLIAVAASFVWWIGWTSDHYSWVGNNYSWASPRMVGAPK